jgi:hypothetical protein
VSGEAFIERLQRKGWELVRIEEEPDEPLRVTALRGRAYCRVPITAAFLDDAEADRAAEMVHRRLCWGWAHALADDELGEDATPGQLEARTLALCARFWPDAVPPQAVPDGDVRL